MTYNLNFRKLGPEHFIWLPLKKVPVIEQFPVNSLEQPALSIFRLAFWSSASKFLIDDHKYLAELADQYDEMGYFLIHNGNDFGIIGVDEYDSGRKPGRATIFNAREITIRDRRKGNTEPTELNLIYASVKLPWRGAEYAKGDIAFWHDIHGDRFYDEFSDD